MRVGVAHHLGWAVAVTAGPDHRVVDRRRIELVEPGMATAPIHHEGKNLDDDGVGVLLAEVRASAQRATAAALEQLEAEVAGPILSLSLRAWPLDVPTEIATIRRAPYEARADSVMYREILAHCARERGWDVVVFEAGTVEAEAAAIIGDRADEMLRRPRRALGPPWNKDHRLALAATIVAGSTP